LIRRLRDREGGRFIEEITLLSSNFLHHYRQGQGAFVEVLLEMTGFRGIFLKGWRQR
jgi:hypothetical protein